MANFTRDSNPFNNNRPRLTASERIKNKRDACIYQSEKSRFQIGKKCGNRNVKYYKNGRIRSMKSYKIQKSLARGNILCNDCDQGDSCTNYNSKQQLNTIYMGNNIVSEFWGGGALSTRDGPVGSNDIVIQTNPSILINSDISGTWDPSATSFKGDISQCDANGLLMCPYGYINNLINIPRNLNGSGVTTDPSNLLFPNELCDPFRYLQLSNLKTYIVIRSPIIFYPPLISGQERIASCYDSSLNTLIGLYSQVLLPGATTGDKDHRVSGIVSSICCIGTLDTVAVRFGPGGIQTGNFGLFDIYIELFHISDYHEIIQMKNILANRPYNPKTPNISNLYPVINIFREDSTGGIFSTVVAGTFGWAVESINLIQGTIPPSLNQTKYNATEQSYMSCLDNGTKRISFAKQKTILPVYNAVCSGDTSGNIV